MGCDIHSIGQAKVGGKWVTKLHRPGGDDRNYDSFAVLANVRNGYGFAGCTTGEGWPVIDVSRGLPRDVESAMTQDHHFPTPGIIDKYSESQEIWLGDHSHSWLLLSELEEFYQNHVKGKHYKQIGYIGKEAFTALKEEGKLPEIWCGGTSGVTAKETDPPEVIAAAHSIQASWMRDRSECLHTFMKYLHELRDLGNLLRLPSDQVRLVFGFDS